MAGVSKRSKKNLESVDPEIGDVVLAALKDAPIWLDFAVISGTRTAEEQAALFRKGRNEPGEIVTYKDGYQRRSRHQPEPPKTKGEAIDIAAYKSGSITWDETETAAVAAYIIGYAKARGVDLTGGVEWGWDYGHIELEK